MSNWITFLADKIIFIYFIIQILSDLIQIISGFISFKYGKKVFIYNNSAVTFFSYLFTRIFSLIIDGILLYAYIIIRGVIF